MQASGCFSPQGVATFDCIPVVLQQIVNFAVAFAAGVAVVFIIYAAYKLVTSRGDREKLESAKHTLTYAIIGLLVIIFAFVIMRLIAILLGINPRDIGIGGSGSPPPTPIIFPSIPVVPTT